MDTSTTNDLKRLIQAADQAITEEDFDALMDFYAEDATLVIKPGLNARGKDQIRRAFDAIAEHFNHSIVVKQGEIEVIQGGDVALVIMETVLETTDRKRITSTVTRRATYVFQRAPNQRWLCIVDNSYGTDVLGAER
jgi:uncharacterized protein (TIGR02246 family)